MDIQPPHVETKVVDPARGVTYRVLAYRTLTRQELVTAVAYFHSPRRKAVKKGQVITIVTVIGLSE